MTTKTKTENDIEVEDDFENDALPLEISAFQTDLASTNVVADELSAMSAEAIEKDRQAAARKRELYAQYVSALVSGQAKSVEVREVITELELDAEQVETDHRQIQLLLSTVESSQHLANLALEQKRLRDQRNEFDQFVTAVLTEITQAKQSCLTKENSIKSSAHGLISFARRRPELFDGRLRANGIELPALIGVEIPIPDPSQSDYQTVEVLRVVPPKMSEPVEDEAEPVEMAITANMVSDEIEVDGRIFLRGVGEFGGAKVIVEKRNGDSWVGLGHRFNCGGSFVRCLDSRGQDLTIRVRVEGLTPRSNFIVYLDQ
jgi:hypothetical protein